jgi:Leucine-rich repeat (LRR) protein
VRLPGSLGRLVQLEKLLVSHNKIEELPPQVGWLRQLKLLHLVDNKLSRLPPQVRVILTHTHTHRTHARTHAQHVVY